ncbi:MAG: beta-hydroxyacyl-ACP dehydratase [Rhodopirellula sp.]|nr:beta-hydroxyacyl-ACP dehydratase [Rhodopirellula sp.]OUX49839.1 MAG: beta-hydroxyacyl-ACP dehydratase [Rhodopirellula sp. TMED283]
MKYRQIDKITAIEPGKRLTAERTLRADEEYLKDHFPRFPVMPGVMMLEALHQAAIWLVRADDDFKTPLVLLRETRSVKFGDFLAPGETLQIAVDVVKQDGNHTTVKASATKQGRVTVSARLILERCFTGDPEHFGTDAKVLESTKEQFLELTKQLTEQVVLSD